MIRSIYLFGTRCKQFYSILWSTPIDVSTLEGRSKERYRKIALNAFTNLLARGTSMAVGIITVPLVLAYVGKELYGFWAAITSFVTWISLFDFGLINGLVNAISEAHGKDDHEAARGYVSTSFFLLAGIMLAGVVTLAIVAPIVPWMGVFAVQGVIDAQTVKWCVMAAILPVLMGMPLSIVRQIYTGYQKAYLGNFFLILGSVATLGGMFIAIKFNLNLPWLILIFGGSSIFFVFVNFAYLVLREMPWLNPNLAYFSINAIKRLLTTSVPLFVFQIGSLLVNNTQPIIMLHSSGLATVADYSVIMKLYVILSGLILWSTNSFVPSFREAFERGDYAWMRASFKRMVWLRMLFAIGASILLLVAGNGLLSIWLHQSNVHFSPEVWLALGVSMIASAWVTAYSDFLTIMDKIWIQVAIVLVNGVATALFTYWLSPIWGVLGAIVAVGFINVALSSWLIPLITRPILRLDTHSKRKASI